MNKSMVVLMLLVLAVSVCHCEDSKTEYAVSVDTTKINLGGQVDQVAEALKKHMEGPMGMYYQAAVARNRAVGSARIVYDFVLICAGILFGYIAFLFGRKSAYVEKNRLGDGMGFCLCSVFIGVGSAIVFAIGIANIPWHLDMMMAPEYVAMNDILTKLGSMVN